MRIERNVAYTSGKGCRLCVHIGTVAVFFGHRLGYGLRVELLTPSCWFRLSPAL